MAIHKSACARRIVYNETNPLEMTVDRLDLERLRKGFAELFDRAAQAVQLAGYEQDDAVFDRYLLVQVADGAKVSIRADWLADRERLVGHITSELHGEIGGAWKLADVQLVGIGVVAVLEHAG